MIVELKKAVNKHLAVSILIISFLSQYVAPNDSIV